MLPLLVVVSLLFSSLSLAAAPPPRRDPIHIPVLRRRHVRRGSPVDVNHYAGVAAGLRNKYNFGRSVSRRAQTAGIAITNQVRRMSGVARPRFITHQRVPIQATLRQSVSVLRKLVVVQSVAVRRLTQRFRSGPNPSILSSTRVHRTCGLPVQTALPVIRAPLSWTRQSQAPSRLEMNASP
jgi:hypothetical protein